MRLNLVLAFAGGVAISSGLMVVGVRHYRSAARPSTPSQVIADATPGPRVPLPDAPPSAGSKPATPEVAPKEDPPPVTASRILPVKEQAQAHLALLRHSAKPSPMRDWTPASLPPATVPAVAVEDHPTPPRTVASASDAGPLPPEEEERTIPPPLDPSPAPAQATPPETRSDPPAQEGQAPEPPASGPHSVTLVRGTQLYVRIGETLSTERNRPGDRFLATLEQPLVIDGFIIAERGARAEGEVVASDPAPRGGNGVSHLAIRLVRLATSDQQNIPLRTGLWNRDGNTSAGRDAVTILATTAIGAAIGAMAAGGKGAGIGAAAGGAAGTAGVLAARGAGATIPVETRLSFRVEQPVRITERLN